MAAANAIHTKPQKQLPPDNNNNNEPNNNKNKFYYHFLFKAALVAIFFVILPMFPSQPPDFINQSLVTRNWELLHILFVGIAISYGLFSRKYDADKPDKDNNNGTKFDNAQTLVSRFLQVSSFFEDEAETTPSSSSDETIATTTTTNNKVQTWNNQHFRKEPVVVVAHQQPPPPPPPPPQHRSSFENKAGGGGGGRASGGASRIIAEKPLLLPVRSLKSRLCDAPQNDADDDDADEVAKPLNGTTAASFVFLNRSNYNNNNNKSKRFSPTNSMKASEVPGSPRIVEKMKDNNNNVVLPSPIPWRSRSGKDIRIDTPTPQYPSSMEESEFSNKMESRSVMMRSQTTSSSSRSSRTSPVSSAESVAKNSEDVMRKVVFCKSCPPPPPPPPPMFPKSASMKPLRYGGSSFNKELKRSFTSEGRRTFIANNKSMAKGKEVKEQFEDQEPRRKSNKTGKGFENKISFRTDKFMPEEEEEEEESFLDKGIMENDHYHDDDDDDESSEYEDEDVGRGARMMQKEKVENQNLAPPAHVEEGSKTEEEEEENAAPSSDVDKKADEFIAKFREQIRLQRIESIKRSTRTSRKSSR